MAGPAFPAATDERGNASGWLIVREDSVIVAADERAMTLVGAGSIATVVGRSWPSLVAASDAALLAMAVAAFERGEAWSGALAFQFDVDPITLAVSLVPRVPGRGEVAVIHLAPAEATDDPSHRAPGTADEPRDLEVLVDTIEASTELRDPEAIARSVLQAIKPAIRFEWGVVLRLFHQDHLGTPPTAEAVATYPTGLAGVDAGAAWTPIDRAERSLLQTGEPSLDGRLTRSEDEQSPLRRLPAFGMRSRLLVPLFAPAGAGVNGAVALYSRQPVAFGPADGIRLERLVRRLGHLVGPAVELAASATEDTGTPEDPPATHPPTLETADGRFDRLADFAAGVAHELNNPLAAVLGYAQLLPQLEEADRASALEAIEAETMRASEVARDLLAFARQQPPARRDVRLESVVGRVLDVLRHDLERAGVAVVTDYALLPPLSADEPQLEQATLHLLRNALEAMPQGGTLRLATKATSRGQRFEVSDSGPGVAAEVADHIFEPFVTTHEDSEHRGMGLAIVYGIAGAHGGQLAFKNLDGGGAQFSLELP